jgi:hypothetical protein
VNWGALTVQTAVDLTVIASSFVAGTFGVSWVTPAIVLATAAFAIWTAIIAGIWWMAPTFQSLRDGSLPMLPRFPFRSLSGPALLAAEIVFKSYGIARFGMFVLLAIEVPIVLFRLLPLLNKHVPRPGDQA